MYEAGPILRAQLSMLQTTRTMFIVYTVHIIVGVMKIGDIVPRAGFRIHICGIPGQCANITQHRLPDGTTIPTPTCLYTGRGGQIGRALVLCAGDHGFKLWSSQTNDL